MRCLEVHAVADLDRLLWCEQCRGKARRRAGFVGWGIGAVATVLVGLWIWLVVQPSADLIPGLWLASLVGVLWIGSKIGKEVVYGIWRFQNRRAAEAVPPEMPGE